MTLSGTWRSLSVTRETRPPVWELQIKYCTYLLIKTNYIFHYLTLTIWIFQCGFLCFNIISLTLKTFNCLYIVHNKHCVQRKLRRSHNGFILVLSLIAPDHKNYLHNTSMIHFNLTMQCFHIPNCWETLSVWKLETANKYFDLQQFIEQIIITQCHKMVVSWTKRGDVFQLKQMIAGAAFLKMWHTQLWSLNPH